GCSIDCTDGEAGDDAGHPDAGGAGEDRRSGFGRDGDESVQGGKGAYLDGRASDCGDDQGADADRFPGEQAAWVTGGGGLVGGIGIGRDRCAADGIWLEEPAGGGVVFAGAQVVQAGGLVIMLAVEPIGDVGASAA